MFNIVDILIKWTLWMLLKHLRYYYEVLKTVNCIWIIDFILCPVDSCTCVESILGPSWVLESAHGPPPAPVGRNPALAIWFFLLFLVKFPAMRALSLVKFAAVKGFLRVKFLASPGPVAALLAYKLLSNPPGCLRVYPPLFTYSWCVTVRCVLFFRAFETEILHIYSLIGQILK